MTLHVQLLPEGELGTREIGINAMYIDLCSRRGHAHVPLVGAQLNSHGDLRCSQMCKLLHVGQDYAVLLITQHHLKSRRSNAGAM